MSLRKIISVLNMIFLAVALIESIALAQGKAKALVVYVDGVVSVGDQSGKWRAAQVDMALEDGAIIKTAKASYCDIAFDETYQNGMSIGPQSEVVISSAVKQVKLLNGRVFTILNKLSPDKSFEVQVPMAVSSVRGTSWESVVNAGAVFNVVQGTVWVYGLNKEGERTDQKILKGGFFVKVDQAGNLVPIRPLSSKEKRRLNLWYQKLLQDLQKALGKKDIKKLIQKYKGQNPNLFTKVLEKEAQGNPDAFSIPQNAKGIVGSNTDSSSSGTPGKDISPATFSTHSSGENNNGGNEGHLTAP